MVKSCPCDFTALWRVCGLGSLFYLSSLLILSLKSHSSVFPVSLSSLPCLSRLLSSVVSLSFHFLYSLPTHVHICDMSQLGIYMHCQRSFPTIYIYMYTNIYTYIPCGHEGKIPCECKGKCARAARRRVALSLLLSSVMSHSSRFLQLPVLRAHLCVASHRFSSNQSFISRLVSFSVPYGVSPRGHHDAL